MPTDDLLLTKIPVAYPPTPEQKDKARLTVCRHAVDAREAEILLSMLGLL